MYSQCTLDALKLPNVSSKRSRNLTVWTSIGKECQGSSSFPKALFRLSPMTEKFLSIGFILSPCFEDFFVGQLAGMCITGITPNRLRTSFDSSFSKQIQWQTTKKKKKNHLQFSPWALI